MKSMNSPRFTKTSQIFPWETPNHPFLPSLFRPLPPFPLRCCLPRGAPELLVVVGRRLPRLAPEKAAGGAGAGRKLSGAGGEGRSGRVWVSWRFCLQKIWKEQKRSFCVERSAWSKVQDVPTGMTPTNAATRLQALHLFLHIGAVTVLRSKTNLIEIHPGKLTWTQNTGGLEDDFPFQLGDL